MKHTTRVLTTTIALAGIATCLGATMPTQDAPTRTNRVSQSTSNMVLQDNDRKIEIQIVNDDATVKINGKEVPAARLKREDGRLIILDEDGKAIEDVVIGLAGPEGRRFGAVVQPGGQWHNFQDQLVELGNGDMMLFNQDAPKVFVGVSMAEPDAALRKHLRLGEGRGVMITTVYDDSPAKDAGLEQYDVIVKLAGEAVQGAEGMRSSLQGFKAGDEISLVVIHEGREREIEVKLAPYDSNQFQIWSGGRFDTLKLPEGAFDFRIVDEGLSFTPGEGIDRLFVSPEDGGGRFFVAPNNLRNFDFNVQVPDFDLSQMQQNRQFFNRAAGNDDLDARLERLYDRIEELEKMLQKLLDRDSDNQPQ